MPKHVLSALLMVLFPFGTTVLAEPVLILFDKGTPPFMYLTTENTAAGIYPAIVAEAFARMGLDVTMEALPWKRALYMSEKRLGGVAGMYLNEERLKKYDFSDRLFIERIVVLQRAKDPFPFTGIPSLKGKTLGVLRGWSYGDEFDKARQENLFIVEEVDGDGQNLAKLQSGHIDAMIAVKEAAEIAMAASGTPGEFVVPEKPIAENAAYLAFTKESGKRELIEKFNKALESMRADGTLEKTVRSILAR